MPSRRLKFIYVLIALLPLPQAWAVSNTSLSTVARHFGQTSTSPSALCVWYLKPEDDDPESQLAISDKFSSPHQHLRYVQGRGLQIKINTSNKDKTSVFTHAAKTYGFDVQFDDIDQMEPDIPDPYFVAAYKASIFHGRGEVVIVEDSSLEIFPTDGRPAPKMGVNLKWNIRQFNDWVGQPATWTSMIAYRFKNKIYIYKGEARGIITYDPEKNTKDLNRYWRPIHRDRPLHLIPVSERTAMDSPNVDAIQKLFRGDPPDAIIQPIDYYFGPMQREEETTPKNQAVSVGM